MKTCVVVPAYNEEARIGLALSALTKANFDVIVVNDGSSDSTVEVIKSFPVRLVEHMVNLGQGAALKTGTELAITLGYDVIVHFDADGQHRVQDIEKLLMILQAEGNDIVIGSRFLEIQSQLPTRKKVILTLARIFSQKILQLGFSDPQSGMRVFRSNVYPRLKWEADDFFHCSEILGLIIKNELNFREAAIEVNYDDYAASKRIKPRIRMGWRLLLNKIL